MFPQAANLRYDIEGLRALAVLAVLVNHAFPEALSGGFAGVDVFFVISGYLIGGQLLREIRAGRLSILRFYARRARRIFPALALVLICVWAMGWWLLTAPELSDLGRHVVAGAFFSDNILLWRQSGYFDTAALDKPLLHLWSLGIEEQFYLLVPGLLWLGSRGSAASIRWVARLGALSLIATILLSNCDYVSSFYLLHTRFWELACGVMLAQAGLESEICGPVGAAAPARSRRDIREMTVFASIALLCAILAFSIAEKPIEKASLILTILAATALAAWCSRHETWSATTRRWLQRGGATDTILSATGFVLIGISVLILTPAHWPGAQTLFPVIGAAFVIASPASAPVNRLLASRSLVFIGGISYPLYLWHWPLLVFYRLASPGSAGAQLLIPLAVSFALAWLTKTLLEDPVRFGRLGLANFRRPSLEVPLLGLVAAAILGVLVIDPGHVPARFPPRLQAVADWNEDYIDLWRQGRCYFLPTSGLKFANECSPTKRRGVPLVLLWGDSHAADLYAGMRAIQSKTPVDIAQWTVGGCPPSVQQYKEHSVCSPLETHMLKGIGDLKPDTVVVAGGWERYLETGARGEQIVDNLAATIQELKQQGIAHVVIFGPGPLWTTSLPVDLFRYMARTHSSRIPDRLGTIPDAIWRLDAAMAARAAAEGVQYVSVLHYFCDETGCLTVGDRSSSRPDLLYRDRDHLSAEGSRLIIAHSMPQLIGSDASSPRT